MAKLIIKHEQAIQMHSEFYDKDFEVVKIGVCGFMVLTSLVLIPSINRKKEFYYLIILDGLLIIFPIFVL